MIILDDNAFGFEKLALNIGATKSKMWSEMASGVDDFVVRKTVAIRITVESIADGSGGIGAPKESSDLSISDNLAAGDGEEKIIDGLLKRRRGF